VHDTPTRRLANIAALWSVDRASHEQVVDADCEVLVAGEESPALTLLAGVFRAEAHAWSWSCFPRRYMSWGLPYFERGTAAGKRAAARVMAAACVRGDLAPHELARWMHSTFHHGEDDELELLVVLDDRYDELAWASETEEDLDRLVLDACQTLLA